jgi:phosphoribosylformylglycinamidine synthase
MRISVVVFPGTNCEREILRAYGELLKHEVKAVWHREAELPPSDLVVLPGGFSYGDYLRTGALATWSPVMKAVQAHASKGGKVLGICNGFQILCESGLLPGVLRGNRCRTFLSRFIHLKVETKASPLTKNLEKGQIVEIPIAHGEGNYFAAPEVLKELEANDQVVLRYCDAKGEVDAECDDCNPNGSLNSIAGICNRERNVLGLMPHPERAMEAVTGRGQDVGLKMLSSFLG